jgi:hypothetical protein
VNQTPHLSQQGKLLVDSIQRVDAYETALLSHRQKDTLHIPTVGSRLSTAYEQLRNASEYAETDLLQQRAIRRYLKRVLSFHTKISTTHLADELVAELTQAEYIQNDRITRSDVKLIAGHIKRYYDAYWRYTESSRNSSQKLIFQDWLLDVLAVRCEQAVQSHVRQLLFAHFAVSYLTTRVKPKKLIKNREKVPLEDMPIVLYIATHRALLKSDNSTIRTALVDSYRQDVDDIEAFVAFNQKLERLFDLKTTVYSTRIVSKNGAALRFIYSGFFASDAPLTTHSLKSPDILVQNLRQHIEHEYTDLDKHLDTGIVRSIIFLLITKGIVGFAIEFPYDLFIYGHLILTPFLINLFFPSVFIAFTRLTLSTPVERNTTAVINQISSILFEDESSDFPIRLQKERQSFGFNTLYAVTFLIVFAALSYILYLLHFNIVQGVIFFVFLSTASFLSFRLSRQIHELEVVNTPQGSLSLLRDVIYMPFIAVGQRISYRYAQINIVAMALDILIELPLKTILRLFRQWTQFLNDKKDEMI